MTKGVTCCYQCPDRCVGCHARCEKYQVQKQQLDDDKRKKKRSLNPIIHKGDYLGDAGLGKYRKKK